MKARTVTISEADVRELEWLRGGLNGLIFSLRMLGRALEGRADLRAATGLSDLAGLLLLADAIEDSEALDRLIDDNSGRER